MKILNFKEIAKLHDEMPPKKMLWSGIKEKSFGLVFGPSKSGKTIFCENFAISLAVGRNEFFGYHLDGSPQKILFIGLEENWDNRVERNKLQYESLTPDEKKLMEENYYFQPLDYTKFITRDEDWESLREMIQELRPDIVFIDSITRMNHGKLEDAVTVEAIMKRLRILSQDMDITLIAIHHTPKLYGNAITMDSIKGSAVFAQESDFAIGINRTTAKNRYMKNVFFRYANDNDEFVKEFIIDDNTWLNHTADVDEDEVLSRTDRRRAVKTKDLIVNYFNSNPDTTFPYQEVVNNLIVETGLQDRQVKAHLSNLVKENKIHSSKGFYSSVDPKNVDKTDC